MTDQLSMYWAQGLLVWYQIICFLRYVRLALGIVQFWAYLRPYPTRLSAPWKKPVFDDVTMVIMTLGSEPRFLHAFKQWLDAGPQEIVVVMVDGMNEELETELQEVGRDKIRLRVLPYASAREQLLEGIKQVRTKILVIMDDRTIPSLQTLQYVINEFHDDSVGGVNVPRKVVPYSGHVFGMWESFNALNQLRRNILQAFLAYFHDGQVLNLAGAFSAYRTTILQDEEFYRYFRNETWLRRYRITTGDDNAFTRWTVQHGWKTQFVNVNEAMVSGCVATDSNYLKQLKRWSRDTARSYLKDVHFAMKSGQRRAYVHAALNIIANYISDAMVLMELGFLATYLVSMQTLHHRSRVEMVAEHVLLASIFTVFEHLPFFGRPANLIHIPGTILYMYIHALVVLFSICTLHKSVWDSRAALVQSTSACAVDSKSKCVRS